VILERPVLDGPAHYKAQEARSLLAVHEELGLALAPERRDELTRIAAAATPAID
jgi:hypothetical protein